MFQPKELNFKHAAVVKAEVTESQLVLSLAIPHTPPGLLPSTIRKSPAQRFSKPPNGFSDPIHTIHSGIMLPRVSLGKGGGVGIWTVVSIHQWTRRDSNNALLLSLDLKNWHDSLRDLPLHENKSIWYTRRCERVRFSSTSLVYRTSTWPHTIRTEPSQDKNPPPHSSQPQIST